MYAATLISYICSLKLFFANIIKLPVLKLMLVYHISNSLWFNGWYDALFAGISNLELSGMRNQQFIWHFNLNLVNVIPYFSCLLTV